MLPGASPKLPQEPLRTMIEPQAVQAGESAVSHASRG